MANGESVENSWVERDDAELVPVSLAPKMNTPIALGLFLYEQALYNVYYMHKKADIPAFLVVLPTSGRFGC